ncbi:TPA: hypothetical protein VB840_001398 [Streptococcus suis]|nr:hypothetical protein [Streptococcus suis]
MKNRVLPELVISIYPKYNNLIKKQIKNFEFRPFEIYSPDDNQIIFWVYETTPTKSIKYKMLVNNPITALSPSQQYGLGEEQFYSNITNGRFAYEIISFQELESPIDFLSLKSINFFPPQNFTYLENNLKLKKILSKTSLNKIF